MHTEMNQVFLRMAALLNRLLQRSRAPKLCIRREECSSLGEEKNSRIGTQGRHKRKPVQRQFRYQPFWLAILVLQLLEQPNLVDLQNQ